MFPEKLKVGGITYEVVFIEGLPIGVTGRLLEDESKIEINICFKGKEFAWKILLHECIHAINNDYNEKETEFLSNALYQLFKDNAIDIPK